jgi:hypothetical protein
MRTRHERRATSPSMVTGTPAARLIPARQIGLAAHSSRFDHATTRM